MMATKHSPQKTLCAILMAFLAITIVSCAGALKKPDKQARQDEQVKQEKPNQRVEVPIKKDVEPQPKVSPVDWAKHGDAVTVSDIEVRVFDTAVWYDMTFIQRGNQLSNVGPLFHLSVRLTNKSATKNVRFGGWNDNSPHLTDEHGNDYKAIPISPRIFEAGGQYWKDVKTSDPAVIQPGEVREFFLSFEAPNSKATEARIILPADRVGGSGELRLVKQLKK